MKKKIRTRSSVSSKSTAAEALKVGTETRVSVEAAFDHGLRAGDQFTLTSGRETFAVGERGGFDVGPVTASITVRENEHPSAAYSRARILVEQLYEAEFLLKRKNYFARLKDLNG